MSRSYIPVSIRRAVHQRAKGRCEYCLISQDLVFTEHQADHIVAEQHGGETHLDNLALACLHCNRYKGPNIASIDPHTKQLTQLFNPRIHDWEEHFVLEGTRIHPLTSVGRVTIQVLNLNARERREVREVLIEEGLYP